MNLDAFYLNKGSEHFQHSSSQIKECFSISNNVLNVFQISRIMVHKKWISFQVHSYNQTLALGPGLPTGPRSPFAPIKPWGQTERDEGRWIQYAVIACSSQGKGGKILGVNKKLSVSSVIFYELCMTWIHITIRLITHLIEADTALVSN